MTKAAQIALDKSIIHWEEELDKENPYDINLDDSQCALCNMFYGPNTYCCDCPILEYTGRMDCEGSPYKKAFKMWKRWFFNPELKVARAAWQSAAQEMIDFMKSLREPVK